MTSSSNVLQFLADQARLFGDPILPDGWRLVPHDAGLRLPADVVLAANRAGELAVIVGPFSLRQYQDPNGYLVLSSGETVHRIVCATWHGAPPFEAAQVRHLDGNPVNNQAHNLAWGTAAENAADRLRHGTWSQGDFQERQRIALDLHLSMLPGPLLLWTWGGPSKHKREVLRKFVERRRGTLRTKWGHRPAPAAEQTTLPGVEAWPPADPGAPDWPPASIQAQKPCA